ncbi:hypothetical protein [Brevibacterium aurantiacum]|uniref:hypothetical protein n=1 Tax=Brevibacterium aurantiacum TaxID=273384 RepID=UPI001436B8B7|nr:hypothetical protein [Brevibacterium aurantiacum]
MTAPWPAGRRRGGPGEATFGEPKEYTATRDGQQVTEEYFHASHIGHDHNVTSVSTATRAP